MKNILIVVISVSALILSVASISGLFTGERSVIVENIKDLGSNPGPDMYSPFLNFNGVKSWYNSLSMQKATTTLCAIQSPAATSTLAFASVRLNTATSTITVINVAKASTAFSSTTVMGTMTIPASESTLFTASTTDNGSNDRADENFIFPPSQWLNVFIENAFKGGANPTGYVPDGQCKAVFTEI